MGPPMPPSPTAHHWHVSPVKEYATPHVTQQLTRIVKAGIKTKLGCAPMGVMIPTKTTHASIVVASGTTTNTLILQRKTVLEQEIQKFLLGVDVQGNEHGLQAQDQFLSCTRWAPGFLWVRKRGCVMGGVGYFR